MHRSLLVAFKWSRARQPYLHCIVAHLSNDFQPSPGLHAILALLHAIFLLGNPPILGYG